MAKKNRYKIISQDTIANLIDFLDEIQFEASGSLNGSTESMQRINFCNWVISELINAYEVIDIKKKSSKSKDKPNHKPNPKSRDQFIEETFFDWNLPEMSDEEFEKLVNQFDGFLRAWEKEYNKKNPKKKQIKERPKFNKPHINDVAEYMSLDEIKEFLLDDDTLSNYERFELYYEEHDRIQREKQRKKEERGSTTYDKMLKDLGISPSDKDTKKN